MVRKLLSVREARAVLRFPLWWLLVLTAITAVLLNCWLITQRKAEAIAGVFELGGSVFSTHEMDERGRLTGALRNDQWFYRTFGTFRVRAVLLNGCDFRDVDVARLFALAETERLCLGGTDMGDAGLRQLADSGRFRRLKTLSLCYTRVTDAGLSSLDGFPRLENLLLDGTRITEDGVMKAARLTHLRYLSVSDEFITAECIKRAEASNPALTIAVNEIEDEY